MRKGFPSVWVALVTAVILAAALGQTQASPASKVKAQPPQFKPGELVVKLKKQAGSASTGSSAAAQAHALLTSLGNQYNLTIQPLRTDKNIVTLKVENAVPMGQLLHDVQSRAEVLYAEPNYIYRAVNAVPPKLKDVVPTDPQFGLDWGLLNTGQNDSEGQAGTPGVDIGATKAWKLGTGTHDIKVAIIDTGVDYTHDELKDNILVNDKEIAGNKLDDDHNGFVDDVYGWNFVDNTNDPMDDNRHGTHCAGTIGARGNNGVGTAGVAWTVSILPVKFLSGAGSGTLDAAVDSIKYATMRGVNIMSNSWGGDGYSQTLYDVINDAKAHGILFIAAASNDGIDNDVNPAFPASYDLDNIISVAATDNRDRKPYWSNYGKKSVHLAAPGVNIFSTVPMSMGGYDTLSGTSMATPHVSGAAALLWSLNPDMDYKAIKKRLLDTVDPVKALTPLTITGGRLNVYNAIMGIIPHRDVPPSEAWKQVPYVMESLHPYPMNQNQTFEVQQQGAKYIRLHFEKIGTQAGSDIITIRDGKGEVLEEISGDKTDYTTDYAAGDKLTVTFKSDSGPAAYGFTMDRYEFVE